MGGFLDGFANGDIEFFERHLSEDVLLFFPGSDKPWNKPSTVASVSGHPPYVQWDITTSRLQRIGTNHMLVAITVTVRNTGNAAPVKVLQTMVFQDSTAQTGDEDAWALQFLQQSPI